MNTAELIAEIERIAEAQPYTDAGWALYHAKANIIMLEQRMANIRKLVALPYSGKFNQEFESPLI
jgi:hypothetical protein